MAAKPLGGGAGGFACQPIHSHLLRHYRNLLSEGENFEGGAAVTTEGDSDGAQD